MAMTYEVWDTETFNRVGTFPTQANAEAFLEGVLRENGVAEVVEMMIVGYREAGQQPVKILDGTAYVAKRKVPA